MKRIKGTTSFERRSRFWENLFDIFQIVFALTLLFGPCIFIAYVTIRVLNGLGL